MQLKDKKVTVIGLGNSGYNAAILLDSLGASVRVTDSNDTADIRKNVESLNTRSIRIEVGAHTKDFVEGSELIVVSPGIEDSSPVIKWVTALKIPIISELELGSMFCKGKIIAITGTNGKSTVTTLVGEILRAGGKDVVVCGNIGNALSGEVSRIKEDTWVVAEASSFQLERTKAFKPKIAAILNITDDHLDRYGNCREYFNEKLKLFRNQDKDDILILNYDAENLRGLKDKTNSKTLFYSRSENVNGAYVKNGKVVVCVGEERARRICELSEIRLKGLHNLENILASALMGVLAGVKEDYIQDTIRNFKGLAHRFETIDVIDGVEYIDDSKGTTVDSTLRALESCERPVVLIAGGKDKNSDYSVIKDLVKRKVRYLILIGEAREKIKKALGDVVETHEVRTMAEAVETAQELAKDKMLVLLSPMCSSFDMFKDYKEKGRVYQEAVRRLKGSRQVKVMA